MSARLCSLCKRAASERFTPFCSKRCADLDLGRWLKGGYAIPAVELPDEDERVDSPDEDNPKPS